MYAFNTLGAVIGSILGGFVLLPFFGTRFSLIFIAVLFFISAMFLIKIVKSIDSKEQSSRFHKFLSSLHLQPQLHSFLDNPDHLLTS